MEYARLLNQEELILEATELIHELLEATETSRAELAERLQTTRGYVTQVLNGSRNMTLRTLADLGFALGHRVTIAAAPLGSVYARHHEPVAANQPSFGREPTPINTSAALTGATNFAAGTTSQFHTNELVNAWSIAATSGINSSPMFGIQYPNADWSNWSPVAANVIGSRQEPTVPKRQTVAA
jgi:transcriptional regulator with XRE-family HTH domain